MVGSPPRVLVTDVQERSGLAAVRALAQAGYEVAGVASSTPAQGHWSRYCQERFTVPDPRSDIDAYAERIEGLLKGSFDIVVPSTDASLIAISEHRDRLESHVRLGLPSKDVVRLNLDKVSLLRIASECDLAPPMSVVCGDPSEVRTAIRDLGAPVLVKPHATCVPAGRGLLSQRGLVVRREADIERAISMLASPLVVQRYMADAAILSCSGVVADGHLLAFAASRYIRTWPPDVGAASFSKTVDVPDDLVHRVEGLVHSTGWQGIFELELLTLNGDAHVIDLNPRLFGWLALATRAGANLPAVWCDWLLGRSQGIVTARAGVHYRWEDGEFLNLVLGVWRGRIRDAVGCLRPYADTAHAAWAFGDPLPLGARVAWVIKRSPRWLVRQLGARAEAAIGRRDVSP